MANFTAADVKRLRELTGAGMMDCKKALEEADGDFDKAVEVLRIKGAQGRRQARRERDRSNGLVAAGGGALSSSTARPTSSPRTPTSRRWPTQVVAHAAAGRPADVDGAAPPTLRDRQDRRRGGRRRCPRASARSSSSAGVAVLDGPIATVYLHRAPPTCRRIGVLVAYDGRRRARPRAAPRCRSPRCGRSTSPATRSRPRWSRTSGASPRRPPARRASPRPALPRIVEGRVNGFFKDVVLLEQPSVQDPKKTVKAVLDEAGVTVTAFARFEVGA